MAQQMEKQGTQKDRADVLEHWCVRKSEFPQAHTNSKLCSIVCGRRRWYFYTQKTERRR